MSLLQHCFTADAKFLTSFRIIVITIMTWCGLYIFFLFNFGTTLSLLSSFNRELRQRCSMHVNRKWDLYLSFIKLCHETHMSISNSLNRTLCPKLKFGHHTARQNNAQGCKRRTFGWRASGSKRLLSSLLKCWIISTCRTLCLYFSFSHLICQTCVKGGAWICGFPFTRVFIPPRFSSPF